ncbi:hypothetical protein PMAYCL1PPCAC_28040, partial [Pristionchus mayeri]
WESLPWPAFNRICYILHTDKDCADLANPISVSTHFRAEVKNFMGRAINRAGFFGLTLKTTDGGLELTLELILTNLPFYDLHDLDWDRCHRGIDGSTPVLRVSITNANDPVVQQSTIFCSARIHELYGVGGVSAAYLSMCAQLLRASTFYELSISDPHLDDVTAPSIIAIASRARKISVHLNHQEVNLTDKIAFVAQLDSLAASTVTLSERPNRTGLFGLPSSFWTIFLNEKLRSNSIKFVRVGRYWEAGEKITKAPILLSDRIRSLEWEKVKAK